MNQNINQIKLVVKDYDEAIDFYINKLDFVLLEDTKRSETKRWVRVAPKGSKEFSLLLSKAKNEQQLQAVGNQTGGGVFLFLYTDDIHRDYQKMLAKGVKFQSRPIEKDFGIVCLFEDLYGNVYDFIQQK
jgi:catechol 2,3-dioxygenase-like lactoylglutathione lyase family enzyme